MNKPKQFSFELNAKTLRVGQAIMYPAWEQAYRRVVAFSQLAPIGSVAIVVGPGGAGKTSMWEVVGNEVYGKSSDWTKGRQPFINISADNPEKAFFSSKNLIATLLNALMDPFSADIALIEDWPIDPDLKADLRYAITRLSRSRSSEADFRRAFVSIARAMSLELILIDEANLMCLTQANRVPTDFLESLRMLAQFAGCRIVLFGTIDLLGIIDYSAQLNRRGPRIHLDRMRFDTEEQRMQFLSFLDDLERELKLTDRLLVDNASALAEFSYGIAGEIVGLLQRADELRAASGDTAIEWRHIEACAPLPDVLLRLQEEADLIAKVMAGEVHGQGKAPPVRRARTPGKRRAKRYGTGSSE